MMEVSEVVNEAVTGMVCAMLRGNTLLLKSDFGKRSIPFDDIREIQLM